jgi:hypothetical protein
MEKETLDIVIMTLFVLCVYLIIVDKYIQLKQEELSYEYEKQFGKKVDVYIAYFSFEKHLFKKYILRKESFIHYTQKEILEESLKENSEEQ